MLNRIFSVALSSTFALTILLNTTAVFAQDENRSDEPVGYTTGAACEKARIKIAEDFLKKNYEVFGLKEERKILGVKEDIPSVNNAPSESNIVASFEQKSGSILETVELRLHGQKNFECDDFRTDHVEVEVTNFKVE